MAHSQISIMFNFTLHVLVSFWHGGHLCSLIPRPHPAFCCPLFRAASDRKLGMAWVGGYWTLMCQLVLVLPHSTHNVLSLPNNKLNWCCLGNVLASLLEFGIGLDNSSLGFFIGHHSCVSTWHYITSLHVMRSLGLPLYNCTLKVTEFITGGCEGLWMRLQYIGVFSPHCLTSHRVTVIIAL